MKLIIGVNAVIKKNNKYLLTKRVTHDKRFHGLWQLPGGGMKIHETIIDCLHREVKEELGINIINEKLIPWTSEFFRNNNHYIFFHFLAEMKNSEDKIILNEEASEYQWFKREEMNKLEMFLEIKDIISLSEKVKDFSQVHQIPHTYSVGKRT